MCGIRIREVDGLLSMNYPYVMDKQQVPNSFFVCSLCATNNLNTSVFKQGDGFF